MARLSLLSGLIPSLIIFSSPCLLEAQTLLRPSANLSSSWTNNNVSNQIILLKRIRTPELTRNTTNLSESMIGFACGFYRQNGLFSFVVGLAMKSKNLTSDKESLFLGDVLWIANRNRPVAENATLNLFPSGNLVLRDADGALVWSTNTTNMSVAGLKIQKTGNLVLYDNNNKTVWQSFRHPGDILLPGQKLFPGQTLVASVSKTNMSEGSFYLSLATDAMVSTYIASLPETVLNLSIPEVQKMELSYNLSSSNSNLSLSISSASESDVVLTSPIQNSSTAYVRFDPDGHLRIYSKMDQSYDVLADVIANECNSQICCANRGLCSNGRCPCPYGFGLADNSLPNAQHTYECVTADSTACENQHSQSLLPLPDIYYFNYNVLHSEVILRETDLKRCKSAFMENCSFTVAVFRQLNSTSHGDCFLLSSQVLSLACEQETGNNYQISAFVKIYSTGSGGARRGISPSTVGIIAGSIGAFLLICLTVGISLTLLRKRRGTSVVTGIGDLQVGQIAGMPRRFAYNELKEATRDFKIKLGEGGFGSVFEGRLENGQNIAVKRLEGDVGQGERQLLAEMKTVGSVHHINLVRVIGFCAENSHKLLVYEFMCNGSLDKWIFLKKEELIRPPLNWQTRKGIIQDIAKGLSYLHEECRKRIVHLDIKPQNILLDHNLHAKISDFGMSTLVDRDQSRLITTMRGTPGYLAPEWKSAIITEKVDVYSFGILVMEVTCGRKNLDRSQPEESRHLLKIFMQKAKDDQLIDLVDKDSDDMQLHALDVVRIMKLALWCLQVDFKKRPSMSMAVRVLEGTMEVKGDLDYTICPGIEREVEEATEHVTTMLVSSVLSRPR